MIGTWRMHNRVGKLLRNRRRRWARSHLCRGLSRRQAKALQRQGWHWDRRAYDRLINGSPTGVEPRGIFS